MFSLIFLLIKTVIKDISNIDKDFFFFVKYFVKLFDKIFKKSKKKITNGREKDFIQARHYFIEGPKKAEETGKKGNRYLDPPRVRVMYAPVG